MQSGGKSRYVSFIACQSDTDRCPLSQGLRGHRYRSRDFGDGRPRAAGDSRLDAYALALSTGLGGRGKDRESLGRDPTPGRLAEVAVLEHGELSSQRRSGKGGLDQRSDADR
jgi:hypothetical protein